VVLSTLEAYDLDSYVLNPPKEAPKEGNAIPPEYDDDFVTSLLHGLDSSYGPFRSAINIRLEAVSPDELIGLLLSEEECLLAESSLAHTTNVTPPATPSEVVPLSVANTASSNAPSQYDGSSRGRGCTDRIQRGHGMGLSNGSFQQQQNRDSVPP
ncbi:hypothetical protein V2J09_016009, partial [Rumex salicifolius]